MDKYVIIYDSNVCSLGGTRYIKNNTYYADSMDGVVIWLQEHPEAMVVAIAKLLH